VVQEEPVLSAIGSAEGIGHRSGLELALGYDLPVLPQQADGRLGVFGEAAAGWFPDDVGPHTYLFFELGMTVDVGRRRSGRLEEVPSLR
jgi:hypothetical protein